MKKFVLFAVTLIFLAPMSFAVDKNVLNVDFFGRFNDPYLCDYVNEAITNNHTAKQATTRVEEYRQRVKMQFANELPSIGVSANYLGISVPKFNPNYELEKNAFVLPFMVNYEADFLLKNRDKTKSSKKTYEMSQLDEISAYLALTSDVATVYTNILQYDKLIEEQTKIVNNYKQICKHDNRKFSRGVVSTTEINNSDSNLESSTIELEKLIKQREVLLMDFSVLLGRGSNLSESGRAELNKEIKRGTLDNFEYKLTIPNEISSDVIYSRPDVKRAELALEKAKIDIRVARNEFLPSFNITGLWAFNTIAPGNFFSWDSSLAALLAGATQDIFTGGRKVANLKYQKARYQELFEDYKQTDLEAVKEVNTSLCIIKHDQSVENETKAKLNLEKKNLRNVDKKFNRGVVSKTQKLNEENTCISRDIDLTKAKTQRLVNYYTLYKAVGGKL